MKHISVTDTTIRQAGKAAGYTLSFREKIELAKLLDRLGVSVIELHAVENPKIDSLLIKSVASAVKESAVCVPVALDPASVSLVWAALREAKHPRIQVPAPVSAVQMEYLAGKKPAAMLEAIRQTVAAARAVCEDVEFLADDATRADSPLRQAEDAVYLDTSDLDEEGVIAAVLRIVREKTSNGRGVTS